MIIAVVRPVDAQATQSWRLLFIDLHNYPGHAMSAVLLHCFGPIILGTFRVGQRPCRDCKAWYTPESVFLQRSLT